MTSRALAEITVSHRLFWQNGLCGRCRAVQAILRQGKWTSQRRKNGRSLGFGVSTRFYLFVRLLFIFYSVFVYFYLSFILFIVVSFQTVLLGVGFLVLLLTKHGLHRSWAESTDSKQQSPVWEQKKTPFFQLKRIWLHAYRFFVRLLRENNDFF